MTKRGIQEAVYEVIKDAIERGLPYITRGDIIKNIRQKDTELDKAQVGQALYHLQQSTKYRRPLIRQVYNNQTQKYVGYTTYDTIVNI